VQHQGHGIRRGALRGLTRAAGALLLFIHFGVTAAAAASQPYIVTGFDSIRVNAPVRVVVTTGGGVAARGEGDRDALDRLELSNSGSLLTVRLKAPEPGTKSKGPITLTLSTGQLKRITLSGGGSIAVDRLKGLSADLALAGSGDISVDAVAVDAVGITITGSGRVTLAGSAGVLNASVSGPGALAAEGLKAKQARIANDGPGTIVLTAIIAADIAARGSGNVSVLGEPACKVNRGGTGRILCAGQNY
jgi:hypothetical protein